MGMHQPDPPREPAPTDTEQLGTMTASDMFSKDEIRELTTASDLQGAFSVLLTWSLIALCFAMVMWSSHPLVILLRCISTATFIQIGGFESQLLNWNDSF